MNDEYKRLDTPSDAHLEPCPCCGSNPRVRQYVNDLGDTFQVVMCTFGDSIGPQNDELSNGCPLYFPSMEAYRATIREAVQYWNEFAKALTAIRRENHRRAEEGTPLEALYTFDKAIAQGENHD